MHIILWLQEGLILKLCMYVCMLATTYALCG